MAVDNLEPVTPAKPLSDVERLTLRHLVQHVGRTFFGVDQVVALDQLAKHEVLKDEDLSGRIGANTKETAKRLSTLVTSRLVSTHSQNEQRDASTNRSAVRKYYYIDYPLFVNLVKWGIAEMRRSIDDKLRNELADKGYICPGCKATYSILDADRLCDPFRGGAFFCESCDTEVVDNSSADDGGKGQRMQRFNARTEKIVSLLKKTDEMVLPKLDVIDWVTKQAAAQHAIALANPANNPNGVPNAGPSNSKAGDGLAIAGANGSGGPSVATVRVEIIRGAEGEEEWERRRKEAERAAADIRTANAVPVWHTHSTVTGDATALGQQDELDQPITSAPALPSLAGHGLVTMDDEEDDDDTKDVKPDLAEANKNAQAEYYAKYYAQLQADQEQQQGSSSSTPIYTPTPLMQINEDDSSSASGEEDGDNMVVASDNDAAKLALQGRKRGREDDPYAEDDEPTTAAPELETAGKSGVMVQVNGVEMDVNDVTDDMHDEMTPEEYEAYFEALSRVG